MLYEIKNDKLSISADTFGAELHSIKLDGKEYLWQCGDAWKRYAPILFPFICSPKDRTYKAGGQEYHMAANHGFARDSEFTYAGSTKNSVSFLLKDNDVTLAQYPYHFELEVTYSIKGSKVTVTNTVKNTDEKAMYFYLGGHPASKAVTLKKSDGGFVKLSFPHSDCIAVWTSTGNPDAQFICLEPWTSVPVYEDDAFEDIENKPHAIKLAPEAVYTYSYTVEVG